MYAATPTTPTPPSACTLTPCLPPVGAGIDQARSNPPHIEGGMGVKCRAGACGRG